MIRSLVRWMGAVLVVLPLVLLPGCEDSDLLAPEGSQVVVTAQPSRVLLHPLLGPLTEDSTIVAQFFNENNVPLEGVSVVFTATGGQLASAGVGGAPPTPIETSVDGIAVDVLTVSPADADGDVVVTARSGTLSETVEVEVDLLGVNEAPTAEIVATPEDQQRINSPVTFNGGDSSDPDNDPITCYEWTINSSIASRNEIVRGTGTTTVTRTYVDEQDLTVVLRVSDDPSISTDCTQSGNPDPSAFSPFTAVLSYAIVCDTSPPVANAGTDPPARSLAAGGGTVSFGLDGALSSDPQSGITTYRWDCRNGSVQTGPTPSVTCAYTTTGTFTVLLTVTNGCMQTASDQVNVVVLP